MFSAFVVLYFYEVMLSYVLLVAPCSVKCGSEQKQKLTLTKSSDLRAQRSINTRRGGMATTDVLLTYLAGLQY